MLLIGDSVTNGYSNFVIAGLAGKANVDVWLTPFCQAETRLYDELKQALDTDQPYAVIHFNIGLHGYPRGRIPEGQYEPLMRRYVSLLRDNAKDVCLIWASITPVTVVGNRLVLDEKNNDLMIEHNAIAAQIMKDKHIPVDDWYGLMVSRLNLGAGDGCHWTADGYKLMADEVTKRILAEWRK